MNRKLLFRSLLIGLPLTAAILYIALNWYRIEYEPYWVASGKAVQEDRFLAFKRLLERMGAKVIVLRAPAELGELQRGGTLVLAAPRLAYMTPQHVHRIIEWVEDGGHLVVQAERWETSDPLLSRLGVDNVPPADIRKSPQSEIGPPLPERFTPMGDAAFDWPGAERKLKVNFMPMAANLRDERKRPVRASITTGKLTAALDFDEGAGRVTILPTFQFFANTQVGHLDHARFAWLATGEPRPNEPVMLFLQMNSPPLGDWLWREAWTVVIATAILIALWLARIVPRFGPLAPDPAPQRRSLAEHIVASGRFLWSRAESSFLLQALRERVMRAARRRGVVSTASATQAASTIAQLTDSPEGAIRVALGSPTQTDEQFTSTVAALRDLESRLARRTPPTRRPRRAKT
jgi:hypothetical protein